MRLFFSLCWQLSFRFPYPVFRPEQSHPFNPSPQTLSWIIMEAMPTHDRMEVVDVTLNLEWRFDNA